jgi:hypothetical protein
MVNNTVFLTSTCIWIRLGYYPCEIEPTDNTKKIVQEADHLLFEYKKNAGWVT